MSDTPASVFVSYARTDRERIEPLIGALEAAGMEVWWDARIEAGSAFARSIATALDSVDAVVVVWSRGSVESDWVLDEAGHGRDRGRLVPISLDGTLPPLGFRQYHFIDFTRWRGAADAPEMANLVSAVEAARAALPPRPSALPRAPARTSRRAAIAGGAALVLAGGGLAGWRLLSRPDAPENSIAVLPFENLSGDPGQGYFSDGLSEELRAKLGEAGGFKVAAQTSSDHFRTSSADAVSIGKQLGVAWLLEGSVRRSADAVRVSAELIEAATGLSRWSHSFDRQLTDIFAVQSEIARTVIQSITGQIPQAAAALLRTGTSVIAAYDAYLKARAIYAGESGEAADRKALAALDAAVAADPDYAQAWALRSDVLMDIASDYAPVGAVQGYYTQALAAAERAIALAPGLARGWLARGEATLFSRHNFSAARADYDKAWALGQNDTEVTSLYAYFAARTGRTADAQRAIDRTLDLDRINPFVWLAKGHILYCAGAYREALRALGQALALNPAITHAHAISGFTLYMGGNLAAAREAFAAEPFAREKWAGMAMVEARLGHRDAAQQALARMRASDGDAGLYDQAQVLTQWGDQAAALDTLERARRLDTSGLTWTRVDPLLAPLRGTPRFRALLASMGLA